MTSLHAHEFQIQSADGHTIHGTDWQPAGNIKAVIQIFHGLGEHRLRYQRFASMAASRGIATVAHDHRGHGPHAQTLGHFADSGGWQSLIDDGLLVNDRIRNQHKALPVILLGHSMGSYLAQRFAMVHDTRINALVLSASTWPSKLQVIPGRLLAQIEAWRLGLRAKSPLLHKLGFGNFNGRFQPARTDLDWLSRDASEVDAYIADPLCGGPYSTRLWQDVLGGLQAIASDNAVSRIRGDLPILMTGGADDPVGGEKGITQLALHYAQTMHGRLSVKLYPGGRHEMFNETNRDDFSTDILDWVKRQSPTTA